MRENGLGARIGVAIFLVVIIAWSVFPILLVVSSSFKENVDIFAVPPKLFSFAATTENYTRLFQEWPQFTEALWHSAIVTACATALVVLSSSMAGYAYSRFRGRLLTLSAFLLIFVRMFPPIIVTLPLFPWVNAVGLNDTLLLLILLYASFFVSLGTWIMKATIDGIPAELDEAAIIDGASYTQLLTRVIFPLAAPGMVAAAVFVVVFAWNEFLFAFIFASTRARTAPMALSEMSSSVTGVDWGVLFAAATLQLVPVLVVVLAAQKYLIAGLNAGSVKG